MSKGSGNAGDLERPSVINIDDDFAQFERLPKVVRVAMANLPLDYCCRGVTGLVRRYGGAVVAARLQKMAVSDYRAWFRREFGCDYPGHAA